MSLSLVENNNIFTMQPNSTTIELNGSDIYLNYSDNILFSSSQPPPSGGGGNLFLYTHKQEKINGINTALEVYDFKNNTIRLDGNSLDILGLFYIQEDYSKNISFTNLTIEVTDNSYASVEGYLLTNFDTTSTLIVVVDNCHVFFDNLPGAYIIPGLIGDHFKNGLITNCSNDYTGGVIPSLQEGKGGICGNNCGTPTSTSNNSLTISFCFSTVNISSSRAGGICGQTCGNAGAGSISRFTILSCYSHGIIDGGSLGEKGSGGICGSECGKATTSGTTYVIVSLCYSTGYISEAGTGGICGQGFCSADGVDSVSNGTISECYATGDLVVTIAEETFGSGGIVGRDCCTSLNAGISNVSILSCYYTGDIPFLPSQEGLGGISGYNCGRSTDAGSYSNFTAKNCYMTGTVGCTGGGLFIVGFCSSSLNGTSTGTVMSCYSAGDFTGNDSGGIMGSSAPTSNTNGISVLTVTSCYSTGNFTGTGSGGIFGPNCSRVQTDAECTVNIISCYSTGVLNDVTNGGICGDDCGIVLLASGTSTVNISCCYTLNGVVTVDGLGTGKLVGTGSTLANINSVDNSYTVIMDGSIATPGRSPLVKLMINCDEYESSPRCVFVTGEAPVLVSFLDCENWLQDDRCLDLFAPELGFCGCLADVSHQKLWPQTLPGETVSFPCKDNILLKRKCGSNSVWGNVVSSECDIPDKGLTAGATVGVVVGVILGVLIIIIFVAVMKSR